MFFRTVDYVISVKSEEKELRYSSTLSLTVVLEEGGWLAPRIPSALPPKITQ